MEGAVAVAEQLREFHGNSYWTAGPRYLLACAGHAAALPDDQACVECGSGLTTLVLRRILGDRLVTFEHDPKYAKAVAVEPTPLRWYDNERYGWYAPETVPSRIGLVVCDGPPRVCPNSRYGLFPVLREWMLPGCTVLLDDMHRSDVIETLRVWKEEFGPLDAWIEPDAHEKSFAIVRLKR